MKTSLKSTSALISLGTMLSKAGGLLRQVVLAAVFGVGSAYDAYNYAYILPGFFLILVGGLNGPLHNGIVTVLSRKNNKERNHIICSINTAIFCLFIIFSGILFFAADSIIHIVGPGLDFSTHQIAVQQIKIMSPIILLSGMIGIGFGALNASNEFFIPSISPLISSFILITSVIIFWLINAQSLEAIDLNYQGGLVLAKATLIGALIQFLIQIPLLRKKRLFKFKIIFDWTNSGIKEVWKIIIPATLSSGMLQINVFTDLFFASNIAGAAAGLSYANFLIQAPLGIISNTILLPLLPIFSKLNSKNDKKNLIKSIRQGFIYCSASMICLGSIFIVNSESITQLSLGRGMFDNNAINFVSGLLICYGLGMPVYLLRDLLVRIFYAIDKSHIPFKVSTFGILINILLDWIMVTKEIPIGDGLSINLGAKGLVLATAGVNIFACISLLLSLKQSLSTIPLRGWLIDFVKLLLCGLFSGLITWKLNTINYLPANNFFWELIQVFISTITSFLTFIFSARFIGIDEMTNLTKLLGSKFTHRLK